MLRSLVKVTAVTCWVLWTPLLLAQTEPSAASESAAPVAEASVPAPVEPPAEATPPPPDPYTEPKARVGRGEQLFEQGNYDAALTEFEQAYEQMKGHPARYLVLFNLAQCYEKLYRYDRAIDAYRRYLAEGGEAAEDAATVRAKMDVLAGLLGTLRLKVKTKTGTPPPSYEVWIDGRLIGKDLASLLVPGGNHEVELRATGYTTAKAAVQLPATSTRDVELELVPLAKEYHGLRPTYFWIATGVAGGLAAAGTVMGIVTLNERAAIDALQDTDQEPQITEEDRQRISNLATTTDILFISAGVAATGAVVLAFLTDFKHGQEEPVQTATRRPVRLGGFVGPGAGLLTVAGSF